MTDATRLEVREIRDAIAAVLDRVQARFGPVIELDADYYWTLDLRTAFDLNKDTKQGLGMAQLSDDVQELRDFLARPDDPTIWHPLSHILGILMRIAALDLH